jgi:hypothetical protein
MATAYYAKVIGWIAVLILITGCESGHSAHTDGSSLGPADAEDRGIAILGNECVKATIDDCYYDRQRDLLVVEACLRNASDRSAFLVAEEFVSLESSRGKLPGWLNVSEDPDGLTLDVSYLTPTLAGIACLREMGSLGSPPRTIEIEPNDRRYLTYVLQFPLQLDPSVAEATEVSVPRRGSTLRMRFGFGSEPFIAFARSVTLKERSIEEWQKSVQEKWQQTVVTAPVKIRDR